MSQMLKVTGIFIIFWSLVLAVRGLLIMDIVYGPPVCCPYCAPGRERDAALLRAIGMERWPFLLAFFQIGAITSLVAGIMGVANCNKPQNATPCFIGGIVATVVFTAVIIFGLMDINEIIIGFLAVYLLYIVGAYSLRKAWRSMETSASP